MFLSCAISEILSIISQKLKRSCDRDHAHLTDCLSIRAAQCTKFEVSSLSRSTDNLGTKNLKWVTWCDHTPFRDSLHTKFEVCICSPTTNIWKATQNRNWSGWGVVVRGHQQFHHSIERILLPTGLWQKLCILDSDCNDHHLGLFGSSLYIGRCLTVDTSYE